MADFYSVASGDWDNPNTWSNTPNGSGGAGVPSSSDTVNITSGQLEMSNLDVTITNPGDGYAVGNFIGVFDVNDYEILTLGMVTSVGGSGELLDFRILTIEEQVDFFGYPIVPDEYYFSSDCFFVGIDDEWNENWSADGVFNSIDIDYPEDYHEVTLTDDVEIDSLYGGDDTYWISGGNLILDGNTLTIDNYGSLSYMSLDVTGSKIIANGSINFSAASSVIGGSTAEVELNTASNTSYTLIQGNFWRLTINIGSGGSDTDARLFGNSFNNLTINNVGSNQNSVTFSANFTYMLEDLLVSTTETLILKSDNSGIQFILSSSNNQTVTNVDLKDSNATGGGVWTAYNSIDSGNNSGWVFETSVNDGGNFLMFFG